MSRLFAFNLEFGGKAVEHTSLLSADALGRPHPNLPHRVSWGWMKYSKLAPVD